MKHVLLFCVSMFGAYILNAQTIDYKYTNDNSSDRAELWEEYISNFVEIERPFSENDTVLYKETPIVSTGKQIPLRLLQTFVFTLETTPDIDDYKYTYGNSFRLDDNIATFVFRKSDTFLTKFGKGVEDCILTVYDKERNIYSQKVIARRSADNRSSIRITDGRHYKPMFRYTFIHVSDTVVYDCRNDTLDAILCLHACELTYKKRSSNYYGKYFHNGQITPITHYGLTERSDVENFHPLNSISFYEKGSSLTDNRNKVSSQIFPVDTGRIIRAYNALLQNPNGEKEQWDFFYAYPDSWDDMRETYQYKIYKNYYSMMHFYIDNHFKMFKALFQSSAFERRSPYRLDFSFTKHIPDSVLMKKLIRIVCNGTTKRGVESLYSNFQSLIDYIIEDTKGEELFRQLSLVSPAIQFGFFRFLFSTNYIARKMYVNKDIYDTDWNIPMSVIKEMYVRKFPHVVDAMMDAYKYYYGNMTD